MQGTITHSFNGVMYSNDFLLFFSIVLALWNSKVLISVYITPIPCYKMLLYVSSMLLGRSQGTSKDYLKRLLYSGREEKGRFIIC